MGCKMSFLPQRMTLLIFSCKMKPTLLPDVSVPLFCHESQYHGLLIPRYIFKNLNASAVSGDVVTSLILEVHTSFFPPPCWGKHVLLPTQPSLGYAWVHQEQERRMLSHRVAKCVSNSCAVEINKLHGQAQKYIIDYRLQFLMRCLRLTWNHP